MTGTQRAIFRTILVLAFLFLFVWQVGGRLIVELWRALRYTYLEIFIFCAEWRAAFKKGWH